MLILNYHRVGTPPPEVRYRGMYVSPQMLTWQIALLKLRGLRFVTVADGVKAGCPKDACAITFDDGYCDNFEQGFPVLKKAGIPATIYVVTGDVGKRGVTWQEAGDKVSSDLMNWQQLKQLETEGWEIGSHASDHVHLGRRTKEEQRPFLENSWRDFIENLGHAPRSFAYPYGSFNQDTMKILQSLGCEAAVTTNKYGQNTETTSKLMLHRQPARGHALHHGLKSLALLWKS